jgi:hypothetical protein
VRDESDDQADIAGAMNMASTVTTIALEMAVPAAVGYWIGAKFGIAPLLAALGAALGIFVGIRSLLHLTPPKPPAKKKGRASDKTRD